MNSQIHAKYASAIVRPGPRQEGTSDLGAFLAGFDNARGPNMPKWARKMWRMPQLKSADDRK